MCGLFVDMCMHYRLPLCAQGALFRLLWGANFLWIASDCCLRSQFQAY